LARTTPIGCSSRLTKKSEFDHSPDCRGSKPGAGGLRHAHAGSSAAAGRCSRAYSGSGAFAGSSARACSAYGSKCAGGRRSAGRADSGRSRAGGAALAAFRISCPAVTKRRDVSGLTTPADWQALCAEAATLNPALARDFFRDRFDWVVVGPGVAFATGYYEPEIRGSRNPAPGFTTRFTARRPTLSAAPAPMAAPGAGASMPVASAFIIIPAPRSKLVRLPGAGLRLAMPQTRSTCSSSRSRDRDDCSCLTAG
jgi:hypothetical protein